MNDFINAWYCHLRHRIMKKNYFVLLWLYMLLTAFNASAASMMDGFTDPEDMAIYFQFGHAWR